MAHVEPLSRDQLEEFEPLFQLLEASMGFVPNSMLTLARRPEILRAFAMLAGTVLGPGGTLDPGLRQLAALIASSAAGCRYCQAHTAHGAHRLGVPEAKLAAAFEFEHDPAFSPAERAALRLVRDSALVPNLVTPEHFVALRPHFREEQIVELVAVSALFGWLNRWNDTMATTLEAEPLTWSRTHLGAHGWEPGKHGS